MSGHSFEGHLPRHLEIIVAGYFQLHFQDLLIDGFCVCPVRRHEATSVSCSALLVYALGVRHISAAVCHSILEQHGMSGTALWRYHGRDICSGLRAMVPALCSTASRGI